MSYYALFQGWLLLSQPPGCLGGATSFDTEPPLRDLSWWSGLFPSRQRSLAPAVSLPGSKTVAFAVCVGLVSGQPPSPGSALPPRPTTRGCTSMHFGENQLSPGSLGISPLPTGHPTALQRRKVRPSSPHYRTFSLPMGSSPGFGSTPRDLTPASDSLSLRLHASRRLTSPRTVTRRLILQ